MVRRECASSWRPRSCSSDAHWTVSCNRRLLLVVGGKGKAVEHCLTAVLEVANCRLRLGDRHQEGDSVLSRRSLGEQAERKLEPTGRTGGCSPRGGRPGFAQDGDGAEIAVPSGVLYVVGAHGRRCALRRERVGAVLVGGKPHPGRAGLVHRVTDQRMPKVEPARGPRRSHQIPGGELIDRVQGVRLPQARGSQGEVELEGVSCHGPGLGEAPSRHREPVEFANDGCDHRAGHVTLVLGGAQAAFLVTPASQLEHVERISSAPAIDAFGLRLIGEAHEHLRVGGCQRAKRYRVDGFGSAQGGVHHRFGRVVGLSPAKPHGQHDTARGEDA